MKTDNIVQHKSNLFAIELTEIKHIFYQTNKKTFDSCLESTTATWWIHLIVSTISLFNEEGLKGEKRVEKLLKLKIWVNDSSHFSSKSHIIISLSLSLYVRLFFPSIYEGILLDISVCLSLSRFLCLFNLTFLEASQSIWLTMFYLTSVCVSLLNFLFVCSYFLSLFVLSVCLSFFETSRMRKTNYHPFSRWLSWQGFQS